VHSQVNLYTRLELKIFSFLGFKVGKITLDNFNVEKAIRSLKFGVYFLSILCIFDAMAEQRKLVYGRLNVTCFKLGFLASLVRVALFGFG